MTKFSNKTTNLKYASNESQKETEKVAIPEDGEVHLQNSNVLPDSLVVTNIKTDKEFTASEDQSFGPGKYFFLAEEGTLFFDPKDAGTRIQIEYLWKDATSDSEESSDEEDDEGLDEDEEEEKKPRMKSSPEDSLWHLDQEWFKWKPLVKKITVNNSLQAKLEKGVDIRRGLKIHNEKTGKELRVVLSGLDKTGNPKRQPAPGEVVYNYGNGSLYWGDSGASGNTYIVEYYINGHKGEPLTMSGEANEDKEYNLLESFKSRAENLWTNLLDNPSPEFVKDTLLPIIEDELDSGAEKEKDEEQKNYPDLTGEFMELEQLLTRREHEDNEDTRQTARDFIETDISPKLSRFYSLASLLAERSYDLQTSAEKDEDFPEFGDSGARSLDLPTLRYVKKVRSEANSLDHDLVDFSKYYTGLLISWILDPDTYYPTSNKTTKKKGKDPRWEGIKRVFEQAGVGLADLQSVALEAFRRALLEFDREKRDKKSIPDPKKFRIYGNPLIKHRVANALKRLFDKYQREQTVESTSRAGSKTITIPEGGGEVDLGVPGLRLTDLQVKSKGGELFTSSQGVLMPTEPEARKSRLVKIVLGRRDKDSQVSVADPETGKKLARVSGAWNAEQKIKIAENPDVFQFNHSAGIIWLSEAYKGKKLLVEAPGLAAGSSAIGKNQYRAHPTRGTLEFSAANGGEEIEVNYSQTIRAKRQVNHIVKTDEEGDESSLVDMKEDEGADPQSKAEEAISQENVDKLLGAIGDILTVEDDPRLNKEDRAILSGLLGVGEPNGQRLTIQEIAARPPFNVDVSDSNKMNQVKAKRQKAANLLLEILKEKSEENPTLKKMVRPLEAVLMGKGSDGGTVDTDKFLGYLNKAAEDKGPAFQNMLVGVLGKAGLKQDEENILRWMWALPGKLRREQDSEEKQYEALPSGTGPAKNPGARLQEIAIDEFGIEADDEGNISPTATAIINKVYDRALSKFTARFNGLYDSRKDFFKERFPEFVQYYDRQQGKQNLRDELSQAEQPEAGTPNPKVKETPAKAEPLYNQIKKSVTGVDESMLHSLMKELLDAHQKGGTIDDLIKQRQADIDSLTEKGVSLLEKKTKDSRKALDDLKKAIAASKSQLESIQDDFKDAFKEREALRSQALSESDEKTQSDIALKEKEVRIMREILASINSGSVHDLLSPKTLKGISDPWERDQYENFAYLRDADGEDLKDAKDDLSHEIEEKKGELREMRKKAVSLAGAEVRKGLRQLKQKVEDLKSRQEKFRKLVSAQETEEDKKREELKTQTTPLQKKIEEHLRGHNSTQELKALEKVRNFLSDRDDQGHGNYAIDRMFELPKPAKGDGYKEPKLAPGEEDTYQPGPRKDAPVSVVEKKPSGMPEEGSEAPQAVKPPKEKKTNPNAEAVEEREKFKPPAKNAPGESQRSLFDELREVAIPLDPDETKKAYQDRLENFRRLMTEMRKHFAEGKSIKEFKPKFSASQTLPNQGQALRAVVEYLRDNAADLKKSPGVWDLKNLFSPTISKPVDVSKAPKPDMSSDESALAALTKAQPSLRSQNQAKTLHEMMRIINRGTPLLKIIKGLRSSGNPNADSTVSLALRLSYFMSLHEDLKKDDGKWDFEPLYSGDLEFPTYEDFDRARPIEDQMGPLVKGIQKNLQDEAGPDGGIESTANTEQRVSDMLHKMSELALHGMSLEQMGSHFEKEDKRGARPYSLAYLFQQVRNFLNRLNRTKGLSNSRNDMGLSDLFGAGAPASSAAPAPTESKPAPSPLPDDDRTTAFRQMAESTGMDENEASVAHRLVASLQLRMESGNKVASELLQALLKSNPKFLPIVKKVLTYIGTNKGKFESGVPGVPNLSVLTGIPFKHPAVVAEETAEPEGSAEVPPLQEILKEKADQASEEQRKNLRKSIFSDFAQEHELDADQKNLFADAIRRLKDNDGKKGIERLVAKTKGTQLEGVFELLVEFFREKGLVDADGLPDFRGVVVPPLEGRESFFGKDGTPNVKKVEKEAPDFDADDISAEMPEPRQDIEESADELTDELGERGRFAPEIQEAVDFLKSDQVDPAETRSTAKERLQKKIWKMMVQEFDFDKEEQQSAAEILEAIQKKGLQAVRTKLEGQGHAEVLFDDLIDYLKEQGLEEEDIAGIELPEIAEDESNDEVGMSIDEMMGDKPEKQAPNRLKPTIRKEVNDELVRQTLDAAKKAQGKGPAQTFNVVEVVRGLEGKVTPEDAKNALMQAVEKGYIELHPESGKNNLAKDDVKFIPVAEDGVPLSSGRIIKLPEPKAAPEPAAAKPGPKGGSRVENLTAILSKDSNAKARARRLLALIDLRAYTPEEMQKAIPMLRVSDEEKKSLLSLLPESDTEAPTPQPASKGNAKLVAQKLLDKALAWSQKSGGTSAKAFLILLQKSGVKKEVLDIYLKIMPRVQKELDAIHNDELDFDVSDL